MRHAKSDWSDGKLSDFDRPLNSRGKKTAPKIGLELKNREIIPDIILSSPANRAKTTAELFAKSNNYNNEINFVSDFYFGNETSIVSSLNILKEDIETAMIVGHNPTMESLISELSENNEYYRMPTAAITILSANIDSWQELYKSVCKVELYLIPKEL